MTKDVNFAKVIKIDIPPIEVLVTGYNEMEYFHICECVASGNRESVNVDLSMCYYFSENTSPEDLIGKWLVIYSMYPYSWIAGEFEEMGDKPEDRNILLKKDQEGFGSQIDTCPPSHRGLQRTGGGICAA